MKQPNMLAGSAVGIVAFLSLCLATQARAATVTYENVGFISGESHSLQPFTVSSSGVYRATLTDFKFPHAFTDLGLAVTTSEDIFGQLAGPGSFDFNADTGIVYYAAVYGVAGGPLNLGLYGVNISAVPVNDVSAVPIPGAMLLLASSLLLLPALAVGTGASGLPMPSVTVSS